MAGLAQLVVHLICNQGVGGSNPSVGTISASNAPLSKRRAQQVVALSRINAREESPGIVNVAGATIRMYFEQGFVDR